MGLLDTIYSEAKKERGPFGLRVGDFVPYVSGLLAADDARLAAQQGNYGEAAGALAGFVPGGSLFRKSISDGLLGVSGKYKATTGAASDESMMDFLAPKGMSMSIGEEKGVFNRDGISVLKNQYGSTRYVLSKEGRPISVLQVMSMGPKNNIASNVYTIPSERGLGAASALAKKAISDYPNLMPS